MSSLAYTDISKIFFDFIKEILYFPLWWYSQGIKKFWQWAWRRISRAAQILAFWIMLKNLPRPLYGDYSFIGVLIGPAIRIFWFVFISLGMLITLIFFLSLFFIYLGLPLGSIYFCWFRSLI